MKTKTVAHPPSEESSPAAADPSAVNISVSVDYIRVLAYLAFLVAFGYLVFHVTRGDKEGGGIASTPIAKEAPPVKETSPPATDSEFASSGEFKIETGEQAKLSEEQSGSRGSEALGDAKKMLTVAKKSIKENASGSSSVSLDEAKKKLTLAKDSIKERQGGARVYIKPVNRFEWEFGETESTFTPDNYQFASGSPVTAEDFENQAKDWANKKKEVGQVVQGALKPFVKILSEMFPVVELVKRDTHYAIVDKASGRCINFDNYKLFVEWIVNKSLGSAAPLPESMREGVNLKEIDAGKTDTLKESLLSMCSEGKSGLYAVKKRDGRIWSNQTKSYINLSYRWPRDNDLVATERLVLTSSK